jgi:hypothetical protein
VIHNTRQGQDREFGQFLCSYLVDDALCLSRTLEHYVMLSNRLSSSGMRVDTSPIALVATPLITVGRGLSMPFETGNELRHGPQLGPSADASRVRANHALDRSSHEGRT